MHTMELPSYMYPPIERVGRLPHICCDNFRLQPREEKPLLSGVSKDPRSQMIDLVKRLVRKSTLSHVRIEARPTRAFL